MSGENDELRRKAVEVEIFAGSSFMELEHSERVGEAKSISRENWS